jgi:serine/threonine protein kinase
VPALESRFILARELSAALSQFHTVKWIHKSFRSNNILFFQNTQSKETTSPFHRPYLFGWEYGRPESGFSSRVDEKDDIEENVYRHPEQWGLPTSSFNRIHDIYSLGVVLLEIGLWKPVISLHRWGFKNVGLGSEVKDYLIESARHQRLRAPIGERYQNVVLSCLQSSFGVCDPTTGTVAVETFKNEVRGCVSSSNPLD